MVLARVRQKVDRLRSMAAATRLRLGTMLEKREHYLCPICGYRGQFDCDPTDLWLLLDTRCPRCGGRERHRLQYLVLEELKKQVDLSSMAALHVAPEACMSALLKASCASYATADLNMPSADFRVDLTRLPFADASYDLVYASHVLEHIPNDRAAVAEIRRILRPRGIAVLPVPILGETTIEYSEPKEWEHVRAPGTDYFDRYRQVFSAIQVFTSEDFPPVHQTFVRFKGTIPEWWPPRPSFMQESTRGYRLTDFVPVCRA
jgi:SAM-dependent methyltransferase